MDLRSPLFVLLAVLAGFNAHAQVTTVSELVDAVDNGAEDDVVDIAPGVYTLTAPLQPKSGMHLRGSGADQTVITASAKWLPGLDGLPDNAVDHTSVNRSAYLIDLGDQRQNVTLSGMTLTGPELHGAVYGNNCDGLTLRGLRFDGFRWSAVRLFRMDNGRIHDNTFVDAGGRAQVTTGQTGGAVFMTFTRDSELWNNRILKTSDHPGNFFGFKGRKATNTRIHHNTVLVGFSLELPFENDLNVERALVVRVHRSAGELGNRDRPGEVVVIDFHIQVILERQFKGESDQ
ncbi:MAG: right-handed parallel beta-helix repeat-containing protein, partial [Pseudomonadota bacterium]